MDGRWILVAGGLLCAVGCTPFGTSQVTDGVSEKPPVHVQAAKPPSEETISAEAITALARTNMDAAALPDDKPQAQREELLEKARLGFERAILVSPDYLPAHLGLAHLYAFRGDVEQATLGYQRVLKINSQSAPIWFEFAQFNARHKNWNGAAQAIGMALRIDPQNRIYAKNLGFYYVLAGETERGHNWLTKTMSEPDARFNIAQALAQTDRQDEALTQAGLALKLDPTHQAAGQLIVRLSGGSVPETNSVQPVPHGKVPMLEPVPGSTLPPAKMPQPMPRSNVVRVENRAPAGPFPILSGSWDDHELLKKAPSPQLPPTQAPVQVSPAATSGRVRVTGITSPMK